MNNLGLSEMQHYLNTNTKPMQLTIPANKRKTMIISISNLGEKEQLFPQITLEQTRHPYSKVTRDPDPTSYTKLKIDHRAKDKT